MSYEDRETNPSSQAGDSSVGPQVPPSIPPYLPPYRQQPGEPYAPPAGATIPPPVSAGLPNPGLAALLGFIPGVGAMYNGQLIKGLIHIGVFALLVSLANDVNPVFGLFIAGWFFYMVIEAHQTATAKRHGLPLPNPFGLNDLGERIGFGSGWSQPSAPYHPQQPTAPPSQPVSPGYTAPGYVPPGPSQYTADPAYGASPYGVPPAGGSSASAHTVQPPIIPPPAPGGFAGRVPTSAIWMIALGCLFLFTHATNGYILHGRLFLSLLFFGLGVLLFVQRSGLGRTVDDGSAAYRWNLLQAARRSGWLILLGILFLLEGLHIIRWSTVWPLFLIYFGLVALAERFAAQRMAEETYSRHIPAVPTAASTGTSVVPASFSSASEENHRNTQQSEEGR